ncbi:MAG: hypothetical protein IMZ60_00905 [Actinobacteria bacterium]|nr:hypothetical protein [Actinomycetota bacterium]
MKKKTKQFLERSINSFLLSIEFFNRPYENGRVEAVFIMLDHSFEMLMKAIIYEKMGKIREKRKKYNYDYKKCINILKDTLNLIDKNQVMIFNIINDLRDNAMHHIISLSEEFFYFHAQAGVTLFNDILSKQFDKSLRDYLPERVLPISTNPPSNIDVFFDKEFSIIQELILPGKRKKAEAIAKLRALTILENNISVKNNFTTDYKMNKLVSQLKEGKSWKDLFPGIITLKMDTEGSGLTYSLRLTKKDGLPVRLLQDGEDTSKAMVIKEVNMLDRYSLNITKVAEKLGITCPKTCALAECLDVQKNDEYFKEFIIGKSRYKRYDPKVVPYLQESMKEVDMSKVWEEYCNKRYHKKHVIVS